MFNSYGDWELRQKLGSGSYGEVFLWINRRTNEEIATKSLKDNKLLGRDEEDKLKKRWQQEFEFSKNINTNFIVRSIELKDQQFMLYLNDNHAWKPLPVMIMEYCNGGDLRGHLQKMKNINGLGEYEIRNILYSVRNAVDYLHNQCNIKHRDLKPDNIVIQKLPNGERRYKLTDFGFARFINDATMLQSVVGTRNYFAPEIIDTSCYTRTVDYWSMGILAFEMLCGTLPFIPHQIIMNIIKSIKVKPDDCIAITEKYGNSPNQFENHKNIFEENHVSTIFRNKIEKWLRLALDKNHHTRGTELVDPNKSQQRMFKFYTVLDELLDTCVLKTFNLSTMTFQDFEIKLYSSIADFHAELCRVTNILPQNLHLVLPVGHPLKKVSNLEYPMGLFVPEWQKTNEIMLYIVDISIKEINAIPEPKISETIKQCLERNHEKLPNWVIQKCAFDIHFSITNAQYHLKIMLHGIKEYAMDVENEILDFKDKIEEVIRECDVLSGRIQQYESMISVASAQLKRLPVQKKLHYEFFSTWERSFKDFQNKKDITSNVLARVQKRNNSALRRIREELSRPFYHEKITNDYFKLNQFREHLREHKGIKIDDLLKKTHICKYCCDAVYRFIEKRDKIIKDIKKRRSIPEISGLNEEYLIIRNITDNDSKVLQSFHDDIVKQTNKFHEAFIEILSKAQKPIEPLTNGNLQIHSDGSINQSAMATSINGLCHSMNDIMHLSTNDLIRDAEETIELMSLDLQCE